MRAVVQRVKNTRVIVDGQVVGSIEKGLLVYLGVGSKDKPEDIRYMCDKITGLRIFEDKDEKMNLSLLDVGGEILVVSQFTLYGDVRKGKRPGFSDAALPEKGLEYYKRFVDMLREKSIKTATGEFGADMLVDTKVDGPVTIMIDSHKLF